VSLERLLVALSVAIAMSLTCAPLVGCGGSTVDDRESVQSEGGQSYEKLLHGLEQAARAGDTYRAARRAHDLDGAEKAMLEEFCDFAWQMKVNHEAHKLDEHPYVLARLADGAKMEMDKPNSAAVQRALDELRAVIDVDKLDGELVRRYSKACYA